jgi:hypothetical protein
MTSPLAFRLGPYLNISEIEDGLIYIDIQGWCRVVPASTLWAYGIASALALLAIVVRAGHALKPRRPVLGRQCGGPPPID